MFFSTLHWFLLLLGLLSRQKLPTKVESVPNSWPKQFQPFLWLLVSINKPLHQGLSQQLGWGPDWHFGLLFFFLGFLFNPHFYIHLTWTMTISSMFVIDTMNFEQFHSLDLEIFPPTCFLQSKSILYFTCFSHYVVAKESVMVVKLTKSLLCLKRSGTSAGGTRSRKRCTMTLHQTPLQQYG